VAETKNKADKRAAKEEPDPKDEEALVEAAQMEEKPLEELPDASTSAESLVAMDWDEKQAFERGERLAAKLTKEKEERDPSDPLVIAHAAQREQIAATEVENERLAAERAENEAKRADAEQQQASKAKQAAEAEKKQAKK
jgi:hypothetical protein